METFVNDFQNVFSLKWFFFSLLYNRFHITSRKNIYIVYFHVKVLNSLLLHTYNGCQWIKKMKTEKHKLKWIGTQQPHAKFN